MAFQKRADEANLQIIVQSRFSESRFFKHPLRLEVAP